MIKPAHVLLVMFLLMYTLCDPVMCLCVLACATCTCVRAMSACVVCVYIHVYVCVVCMCVLCAFGTHWSTCAVYRCLISHCKCQ